MRRDDPERVAACHVPGSGKPEIRRLGAGLVNETFRVLRDGLAYSMRLAVSDRDALGLDRAWEARLLEHAAATGLAPELEYCDPARGILIARWIEGRTWTPQEARRSSNIARMAEFMRRIHALPMPAPPRSMSPAKWIEYYSAALRQSARRQPEAAAEAAAPGVCAGIAPTIGGSAVALQPAATKRLAALAALPSGGPALCHSDLHTLNLIDRGASLVLLDWEYAHASDPFWDLAGWGANNDFEEPLLDELLASYAGRPPSGAERSRLELMSWLYDYVCLWWSELYLSVPGPGIALQGDARAGVSVRALELAARLDASK